jgi:hypothetical protein
VRSARSSQMTGSTSVLTAVLSNNRVHQVQPVHICKRADIRAPGPAAPTASSDAPRVAVRFVSARNASATPSGVSGASRRSSKEGQEAKLRYGPHDATCPQSCFTLAAPRIGRRSRRQGIRGKWTGSNWAPCPAAHLRGIRCSQPPLWGPTT